MNAIQYAPYCGDAPTPAELLTSWNFDPVLIMALLLAAALSIRLETRERIYWLAGIATLVVAFVSPLCALTSALFSARSVHHIVIVGLAAPLFAMALPRSSPGAFIAPLLASSVVLWIWHWPVAYSAALESYLFYWSLQIALLATFIWFWRAVLSPASHAGPALVALCASAGQMGLLAGILTLAPRPLYDAHLFAPLAFGFDALRDQQLAGLVMWVPAFFIYAGFAIATGRRLELGAHA